jgi:capsular polysaccharide transport system permease protein
MSALATQRRVLSALVFRELITRYGRHNIGMLWLLVEPMLFALGVVALWSWVHPSYSHSVSIAAFAITGYCPVLMWRNCANRCALAIEPNSSLLHHRQVRILDFLLARNFLEVISVTIVFILLIIVFSIMSLADWPQNFLLVLLGWLALCCFSVSLGLIVGALSELSEWADKIWHPLSYFLFPVSGAVYLVDWLPESLRQFVLWIPIVQATEMLRGGYFGGAVTVHFDIWYATVSCLMMLALGLMLSKLVAMRVYPR